MSRDVALKLGTFIQVMKFWAKAERVVNYKNKSLADARKKEVMDKHLNFLVEQTQRYSSMLAQRLHTGGFLNSSLKFIAPELSRHQ